MARVALNPQATLLLSVDEDGRAILVNFVRRTVLYYFNFKEKTTDIQFSPDGKHFAVAAGKHIQVWKTPDQSGDRQFAPFVRHRIYTGHYSEITSITWSPDGRFFLTSSKDLTSRVYSLDTVDSNAATTLGGHRDNVVGAFFSEDQETIYTVSKDGALFTRKYIKKTQNGEYTQDESEDEEDGDDSEYNWRIVEKHYFNQPNSKLRCATFHPASNLLVCGFSTGLFTIHELPDFSPLQTLSISQNEVDFVTINKTGEWLAFGASKLGQLLVWEWQSESYVLKQQSHYDSLNGLVYSPDGSKVVTASDDGKIKVWDAVSGFSIVTFTEHTAGVTALCFNKRGNVLFSASLDGSVRAWDLLRYRNFRTFTSAKRIQFTSLAVDPSGEIVCAGSLDDPDVHLWSVQSAQLLDRLAGHEAPVSSLGFASGGSLISGSWDKTIRVWNIFGRQTLVEPFQLQSEVTALDVRPDSLEVAVTTMDGQISFWDIKLGKQTGVIDGREDIAGGRHASDRFTAANSQRSKFFTTICYSADGKSVLAGGNSKYVCMYDVSNTILLRRFTVSKNMSIDGTLDLLNSKNMTEAGPMSLIDTTGEASDLEDRIDNTLPGAQRGDASVRKVRPAIKVSCLQYSPSGRSFAAASTEGLLIYSVDEFLLFDPFDLDVDITVDSIQEKLSEKDYLVALVMAFRLGEQPIIQKVFESIPFMEIDIISRELPVVYLERMLRFISNISTNYPHVEFLLLWIKALITYFGREIIYSRHKYANVLRGVQKFVISTNKSINELASENIYYLTFLKSLNAEDGVDVRLIKATSDEAMSAAEEDEEIEDVDDSDEDGGWFGLSKTASGDDDESDDDDDDDDHDQ